MQVTRPSSGGSGGDGRVGGRGGTRQKSHARHLQRMQLAVGLLIHQLMHSSCVESGPRKDAQFGWGSVHGTSGAPPCWRTA